MCWSKKNYSLSSKSLSISKTGYRFFNNSLLSTSLNQSEFSHFVEVINKNGAVWIPLIISWNRYSNSIVVNFCEVHISVTFYAWCNIIPAAIWGQSILQGEISSKNMYHSIYSLHNFINDIKSISYKMINVKNSSRGIGWKAKM